MTQNSNCQRCAEVIPPGPARVEDLCRSCAASVVRVAAGVLRSRETGNVYVGMRAGERSFRGCWEYPGGKLEENETQGMALVRKWREELSVHISVGREIFGGYFPHGDGYYLNAYLVHPVGPFKPRLTSSHSRLMWVRPDDLLQLSDEQRTPSTEPVTRALLRTPSVLLATG